MTAIGIDLGTSNSCAAVWRGGEVLVIKDHEGQPITPSVVSIRESGETLVGPRARRDHAANPEHCYRWVKRLVGRRFDDPQVALLQSVASYRIAPADNGEAWIQGRESLISPVQISAHVLRRLKDAAEIAIGKGVDKAVITVPAYFNNAQRTATLQAGEAAGLQVIRIINEPTAAALALGLDRATEPATVAVYDLGGGTFDLSILSVDADGEITVLVSNGDTFLGGEDFDRLLVDYLSELVIAEHHADPRENVLARARLKEAAEEAKVRLSFEDETQVVLGRLMMVGEERKPVNLDVTVTRAKLEALTGELVARTIRLCDAALREAELDRAAIDKVVLVGGQTRMPLVHQAVRAFFGRTAVEAPDPDQMVARGAAIMAAALTGQMAVELADVTPFAICVQDANEQLVPLISAQSRIPAHAKVAFTVAEPDQSSVMIRLRQGNAEEAADNLALGRFDLEGVRPDKAGRPIVDVSVDIDVDGVMTASARDRASGRPSSLVVDTMGLSPRAIAQMAKATARAGRAQAKEERNGTDQPDTQRDAPAGADVP